MRDSIPRFAFYTLFTIPSNYLLTAAHPAGYLLMHLEVMSNELYRQESFTTRNSRAS